MQLDTVLEKLRVLHLDLPLAGDCATTGQSLSIYKTSKPAPHSDALPPTKQHLLQQGCTSYGQAFKHMDLRGPFLFKPPQSQIELYKESFRES